MGSGPHWWSLNRNSRFRAEAGKQPPQIGRCQRNAAGRRGAIGAGHMEKNCASPPRHPRTRIVVELDDKVVETIGPPQTVARSSGRTPERPIVARVQRVLAPSKVRRYAPHREQCCGAGVAIGPPPQPYEPKPAARGPTIAFKLVGTHAATTKHNRDSPGAGQQKAPRPETGPCTDPNHRQTARSHRATSFRLTLLEHVTRLLFYARVLYFAQSYIFEIWAQRPNR